MSAQDVRSRSLLKRVLPFLTPFRWRLATVLAIALLTSALGAAEPLMLMMVFDRLAGAHLGVLVWPLCALFGIMLAREGFAALLDFSTWRTRIRVQYAITE